MIDIHCHVLHGIDDGPSDMETSVKLCSMAYKEGIRKIIATPHYIFGESRSCDIKGKVEILNNELEAQGIDLMLFPGNEVYICYELADKLKSGVCLSLNNSRYILLELPMLEVPGFTEEVIFQLRLNNYIPIIAHPERNRAVCENPEIVYKMVEAGCLVQLNSTSLFGASGKKVKYTAELLARHNLAHFVATDAHSVGVRRPVMEGIRHVLNGILGQEKTENIMIRHPDAVIRDCDIAIDVPLPIEKRQSFWTHLKR